MSNIKFPYFMNIVDDHASSVRVVLYARPFARGVVMSIAELERFVKQTQQQLDAARRQKSKQRVRLRRDKYKCELKRFNRIKEKSARLRAQLES